MRFTRMLLAVACLIQEQPNNPALPIPRVKASIDIEKQPVEVKLWGTVSATPSRTFALALTVDLGDFQEHLASVFGAQLNRSDRCGDRLCVERAAIAPLAPSGPLTANVNFERFGCVKNAASRSSRGW
jgi:hypothetical protein